MLSSVRNTPRAIHRSILRSCGTKVACGLRDVPFKIGATWRNVVQPGASACLRSAAPGARVANREPAERARLAGPAESPEVRGEYVKEPAGVGKPGWLPCPRRTMEHAERGYCAGKGKAS